jgi:hypothetical protein
MSMTRAAHRIPAPSIRDEEGRLNELLDLHLHPLHGSRYWLRRQEALGWDVCDRVRTPGDLWLLGPTPADDLRRIPLTDFIPRVFHRDLDRFVIGETGGTTGPPCATAYRDDEFQMAFVDPFVSAAQVAGFPQGEPWLWVGPSGPHIIGKAVRELARQTGSMDPFSVDFDPRWARRLAAGSLAQQRYLDHVTDQALDVLRREPVGVLFITPPALGALARRMTDRQREAIHGVHYGGMSLSARAINAFRAAFPCAVHLAGYGNTLFGVVMEVEDREREALDYFPTGDRLRFHVAACAEGQEERWPPRLLPPGETGRVVFDRLDESCLLAGVVERDDAELVAPSPVACALGARVGLRNPRPPARLAPQVAGGLY